MESQEEEETSFSTTSHTEKEEEKMHLQVNKELREELMAVKDQLRLATKELRETREGPEETRNYPEKRESRDKEYRDENRSRGGYAQMTYTSVPKQFPSFDTSHAKDAGFRWCKEEDKPGMA